MIAALQLWLAPLAAGLLTLWAGLIALAAEGDPQLPRAITTPLAGGAEGITAPRGLHIVHLALLVVAAALASVAVAWWLWPPGRALARLAPTVLLVWTLGDLLPRVVATLLPQDLLTGARGWAERSLVLFRPLLRALAWTDRRTTTLARPERGERSMLAGVFSLSQMTVAEVMTPRIDIVAVDRAATSDEAITVFRTAGYARLIVYDNHPDAVAGALYAKDLLNALHEGEDRVDWRALIRPVTFVPEAKTLDRQLRDFQRGPSHLAVVVDEFGGTAGLVTLEDILEQIVGEIHDEHDVDEVEPIQRGPGGELSVQGGVALTDLEAEVGRRFGREDVDTVGGLVLAALGRVPRVGDHVRENGISLHVDQVIRRRVKRVTVTMEEDE